MLLAKTTSIAPLAHVAAEPVTTADEQAINDGYDTIMAFHEDETASFLTLD